MAGRGTDIMLGGNSEYLAKQEMKRNKIPENLIEEANTYYETEDQDILNAREMFKKLEKKLLSEDIDYNEIKGLRLEARQKLNKYKPYSIGQASRISGVSPADISVLLIYLEQKNRK